MRRKSKRLEQQGRGAVSDLDLRKPSVNVVYWIVLSLLLLGTLTTVFPLFWGFMSALKTPKEIFGYPPTILPRPFWNPLRWHWENYVAAFTRGHLEKYFLNTVILAVGVWAFQIIPSALAGYALSKLRVPLLRIVSFLILATLMVPFYAILIPLYFTVIDLPLFHINLVQNKLAWGYLAIMLPAGVSAFNIFIFKSFFDDIPTDLLEAARIDGAGELRIFTSIVVPLSQPVFAVLTIFSFMATWNDFLWPMLAIPDTNRYTIMLKLYLLDSQQADFPRNVVFAALMLATIPPMVIFAIFQKRIMQGISLTGLKV
jgi:multiple sugar transport system permease protein